MIKLRRSQRDTQAPKSEFAKRWQRAKKNIFVSFFLDLLTILGSALVLSLLLKTFLIRSFFIPSGSMLETLQINDRIVVNELVPNVVPIERGDVVVFRDPGGWLGPVQTKQLPLTTQVADWFLSSFGVTAPDSDVHLVKRVIGIAGDHVVCCDAKKRITVNGVPLDEPYIKKGEVPSTVDFDVIVPADSIWVMGDNRGNSEDSRFIGPVPREKLIGRAHRVAAAVEAGMCFVNSQNVRDLRQPFGGTKASGTGREGGTWSYEVFCEPKNVAVSLGDHHIPHWGV